MVNLNDLDVFLDSWFAEINKLGIDVSPYKLDHVGYSVSSGEEYEIAKNDFSKTGILIKEPLVSGRRVGVFRFNKPLEYKNYLITAVELIEPKTGEQTKTGFEHAEFTIDIPLNDLANKYPAINWDKSNIDRTDFPRLKIVLPNGSEVKFNTTPVLES